MVDDAIQTITKSGAKKASKATSEISALAKSVDNIGNMAEKYSAGKVNNKFQQFADDYGFKVQPCIAGHPHTKAKVEAPMKILDEIRAYNGKLNYRELL